MSDKKVRIGFVGVGNMGQAAHLRNYVMPCDSSPWGAPKAVACEVVAISDVKQMLAAKVAARWGVSKVYASHEEMLANEELDGIVASQPFTRHGTLVPELLRYGKPVLTEKPIAGSVEQGEKIVATMKDSKTWMMIGYHKRSDPATMLAKAEIEKLKASGELGRMTYIRILMPAGDWVANGFCQNLSSDDPNPSLTWDPPASDMDKATNDAYTGFVNYYIHQVNLMRHLLGETWKVKYADPAGRLLAGESPGGVTCSIEMSPYQTTIDWQESALVCFERGWVKLELPAPLAFTRPGRVEVFRDPGKGVQPKTEIPQLPWVHAMWQQALNFVDAVAGTRPPLCSAEDALEDIRLAREYIRLFKGR
jgi:predicted dehydrogenase